MPPGQIIDLTLAEAEWELKRKTIETPEAYAARAEAAAAATPSSVAAADPAPAAKAS